jgi:hypothetical protein
MNKDERQMRLKELLRVQKQKEMLEHAMLQEKTVREAFEEALGDKIVFEILDTNETRLIIEDMCETFPITSWNRIDWADSSVNQMEIKEKDISSIPLLLKENGFNSSSPIYVFWGYEDYPCVKTILTTELLEKFDEIIWLGSDMYYYCPVQKYLIEFFHDDSINIGFIYKEKEKKNGRYVSIRDKGENSLLEVERKGNQVEIVTYVRNEKTTKFTIPVELFEKMSKGMIQV